MCYNFFVKTTEFKKTKYFVAAITAAILCSAALNAGGAAFADAGEQTEYPEIFTESVYDNVGQITDYAVGDGATAIADGNKVIIISDDQKTEYDFGYNVRAVDCEKIDGETVFYCRDASGKSYSLPDKTEAEHDFTVKDTVPTGKFTYYTFEGVIYSLELPTTTTKLDGCSLLKEYGGKAYVVKENKIHALNGTDTEVLNLFYTDFKSAGNIAVGDSLSKLRTFGGTQFVMLTAGAFKTEVDLNDFSGRYFKTGKTSAATEGETALLLCTTGNAALVINGSDCYITLARNTEPVTRGAESEPAFANATVCVPYDFVYASPALVDGVKLKRLDWGAQVKVLALLSAEYSPELSCDFYKISYTDDSGIPQTGYIPCNFLTEYKTDDAVLDEIPDPGHNEEDLTKTVMITVLIIALVLIALGYLVYVGTSGKDKKSKKSKEKQEKNV